MSFAFKPAYVDREERVGASTSSFCITGNLMPAAPSTLIQVAVAAANSVRSPARPPNTGKLRGVAEAAGVDQRAADDVEGQRRLARHRVHAERCSRTRSGCRRPPGSNSPATAYDTLKCGRSAFSPDPIRMNFACVVPSPSRSSSLPDGTPRSRPAARPPPAAFITRYFVQDDVADAGGVPLVVCELCRRCSPGTRGSTCRRRDAIDAREHARVEPTCTIGAAAPTSQRSVRP